MRGGTGHWPSGAAGFSLRTGFPWASPCSTYKHQKGYMPQYFVFWNLCFFFYTETNVFIFSRGSSMFYKLPSLILHTLQHSLQCHLTAKIPFVFLLFIFIYLTFYIYIYISITHFNLPIYQVNWKYLLTSFRFLFLWSYSCNFRRRTRPCNPSPSESSAKYREAEFAWLHFIIRFPRKSNGEISGEWKK